MYLQSEPCTAIRNKGDKRRSTRRGLTAREVLSVLTDIPDDVSEYGDESCSLDADDDFIPAADESSSSSEHENVNAASM